MIESAFRALLVAGVGHSALLTAGLLVAPNAAIAMAAVAVRVDEKHPQDTNTTTADKTAKTATDTAYGKIESYDPGKSIKVTVPGKLITTKSFDLDDKNTTVDVASNLKVGEWVSVAEKTDSSGHKTITVKPSSEKHASQGKTTSR